MQASSSNTLRNGKCSPLGRPQRVAEWVERLNPASKRTLDMTMETDTTERSLAAMPGSPLNGLKTHPLTDHAKGVMRQLLRKPVPTHEINAGVIDRLQRGGWVRMIQYLSPYKKHKGGTCPHLTLNESGREYAATL